MQQNSSSLALFQKEVGGLVTKLFGPAADEVGLILAESIRLRRFKNSIRVFKKAEQFLEDADINPQDIPLQLLVPLLEGASLQENDALADRWAALIARAADPDRAQGVLPSFITILGELAPDQAQLLDWLLDRWNNDEDRNGYLQAGDLVAHLQISPARYEVITNDLIRLGLCRHFVGPRLDTANGHDPDSSIHLMPFGIAFVEACRAPETV